jgi:hypothetical protein
VNNKGEGSIQNAIYKDGVKRLARSSEILLNELNQMEVLDQEYLASEGLFRGDIPLQHFQFLVSGMVIVEATDALRTILRTKFIAVINSDEPKEIEDVEFYPYFEDFWKSQGMDWLLGRIRSKIFVEEFRNSGCTHLISRAIDSEKLAFLNEENLKNFTTYNQELVEYLCNPIHFKSIGFIQGFCSNVISIYLKQASNLGYALE